jgi:hypothetical protein
MSETGYRVLILALVIAALAILSGYAISGLKALAKAISFAEGYGIPGAIPTDRNNPGDLKLSAGTITTFATPAEGWAALYHQLGLIASGASNYYQLDMSIGDMGRVWTATEQSAWSSNVASWLRDHWRSTVTTETTLREILL